MQPDYIATQLVALLHELPAPPVTDDWLTPLPAIATTPVSDADSTTRSALRAALLTFGMITPDGSFVSATAYYFCRALILALQDYTLSTGTWRDQRGQLGFSILEAMERARLKAKERPTPLRELAAVMSVIKKTENDKTLYLMQYDAKAEQYQPIGGKREETDADDQAALLRELSEELNLPTLVSGTDLELQFIAAATVDKVSPSLGVLTRYRHAFFHVVNAKFLTDATRNLTADGITLWIDSAALEAGRAPDGRAISRIYHENIWDVLDQLDASAPEAE